MIAFDYSNISGNAFAYLYPGDDYSSDSEISLYSAGSVTVYTNLEYQQLRAAKALEESANAAKDSSFWNKISTIALIITASIAVISIYHNYLQKRRNIRIKCKFEGIKPIKDMYFITDKIEEWLKKVKLSRTISPQLIQEKNEINKSFLNVINKLIDYRITTSTYKEVKNLDIKIDNIIEKYDDFMGNSWKEFLNKPLTNYRINKAKRLNSELKDLAKDFLETDIPL